MLAREAKTLLISSNLWYFGSGMLSPIFAVFAQRVGGDILEVTWAWAAYLLAMGIFTLLVGRFSDRLDKGKVMLVGYFLNAAFTFSYLLVSSPLHLFAVQVGLGLAMALATPTWDALYSEYVPRENSAYLWGIASGYPQIVGAAAAALGGAIIYYLSFDALFISMGAVQMLAALVQAKMLFKSN